MTITITTQEVAELVTQMQIALCTAKAQAALAAKFENKSTTPMGTLLNTLHNIWGENMGAFTFAETNKANGKNKI